MADVQESTYFRQDSDNDSLLAEIELTLDEQEGEFERKIYGILELIGDVGGVMDIILLIFGIFIIPYAEAAFRLKQA